MTSSSSYPYHLRLLGMAVIWGASWPWGRVVAQSMPPLTGAALRFMLAGMALLVWLLSAQGTAPLRRLSGAQWLGLSAAAASGICAYAVFFMYGLQSVAAGRASVVVALNPVLTLLLAAWLFRERLNLGIVLGMLLAVSGALTAITQGHPLQLLNGGMGRGELLLLGCVVSWSAYTLLGRKVLKGIDALTATTVAAVLGSLMLLLAAAWIEGVAGWQQVFVAPLKAWVSIAALAFGATTLSYSWYFRGVQHLGVGVAAAYIVLVPIFGILSSALMLGEPLHASLAWGGLLAAGGMMWMNLARR
jgi:drug/metabolite transporter (DMT)-like permease